MQEGTRMPSNTLEAEKPVFSNAFGSVTDRRVIYFREKGWISGGSREDVPIKHITSVRVDITRRPFWGAFLLLLGVGLISSGSAGIGSWVVAAFLCSYGILLLWGSPTV